MKIANGKLSHDDIFSYTSLSLEDFVILRVR